jgi:hypothetical protein
VGDTGGKKVRCLCLDGVGDQVGIERGEVLGFCSE